MLKLFRNENTPYFLSEVKVLQRNHLFQDCQGTGLICPLQLRMLPSPFSQLLCIAVTAIHVFNTVGHPWLQFLEQPSHPGKQAGSCQDLRWIKLIENSDTFTHAKRKRSTLPVANANEELLGHVWKRFLCNRCHPCDVKNLCVLPTRVRTNTEHRAWSQMCGLQPAWHLPVYFILSSDWSYSVYRTWPGTVLKMFV